MAQPVGTQTWYAIDLDANLAAREAVEYALMESGALGTETNDNGQADCTVSAYFDRMPDRENIRAALAEALRIYDLPTASVRDLRFREVANQDWLGEWKKSWQPTRVGDFVIAPPWTELAEDADQLVIRIEPGMAFGTGTHETTRLCLRAVKKYFHGNSFLDVGTGTGILAIAAAKLFPDARIEALDTDADAVEIARVNAQLNSVAEQIEFRVGTVAGTTASADLVCANLTADVIIELLPQLIGATCGRLVLSGILEMQLEAVITRLHDCGIAEPIEIMQDGEWVALIV